MPKYWTKLSLFSFLLFIASTAPAALALGYCEGKVTGPQTIAHDSVKSNTFTYLSNRFMQIMWEPFLNQKNLANVADKLFGELIGLQIDELERVHNFNRELANKSVNSRHNDYNHIHKNLESMDRYISVLRSRLSNGPLFKYGEYLLFSTIYTDIHDLEAVVKVAKLKTNPQALADRYPGVTLEFLDEHFDFSLMTYTERLYFWKDRYDSFVNRTEKDVLKYVYKFDEDGTNSVLPFPTPYPSGSFAFYSTYALPVLPVYLAIEAELQDYTLLITPAKFRLHENGHVQTTKNKAKNIFMDVSKVESLVKDLENLRTLVLERNDNEKYLSKTLYYLVYWLKYESFNEFPFTLSDMVKDFEAVLNGLDVSSRGPDHILNFFDKLPDKYRPAPDRNAFASKIAEIIKIANEYQAKK